MIDVLAAHQPDLLPYSGFWWKMHRADVFDVAVFDQLQQPGYQNRVRMRGQWCTLPVAHEQTRQPIKDVRIDPDQWQRILLACVSGRYRMAPLYPTVFPWFADAVVQAKSDRLWQFNLALMMAVRDRLGIRTPVAIGSKPRGRDTVSRLFDVVVSQYDASVYLSGLGAKEYLGGVDEASLGFSLRWSTHVPTSGDSVLSLLMDMEDPMTVIRRQVP